MEKVRLIRFLKQAETVAENFLADPDFYFSGISIDSRTLQPGEVFVAITGEKYDGHQFIPAAIEKGAIGVVYQEAYQLPGKIEGIVYIPVSDTLRFLMEFAGWYRSQFKIPVVGLTGSSGKTTTKEMLSAVLQRKFQVTKTFRNLNNFIGTSLTLLEIQIQTEIAVIEIGTNHPGEIAELAKMVHPTHAAITNIGSGHIGFFGSREAIYKEKTALFEVMKENSDIFINVDDPYLQKYQNPILNSHTFGVKNPADFRAEFLGLNEQRCARFRINNGPEMQLSIPGQHQLQNALLAGAIGLYFKLSPDEVKAGLESDIKTDKRMEITRIKSVRVINDAYNANPESMQAAIDFLNEFPQKAGKKKILILGDMLELGSRSEAYHRNIGKYLVGKKIDTVYCLGEDSRFIIEELKRISPNGLVFEFFDTYEETVQKLREVLAPDDIILLKGSRGMALENILTLLESED
jgi:UDP-N-acetylmuramoyl-tripeptide--D-alanyl-D-alanine ligase